MKNLVEVNSHPLFKAMNDIVWWDEHVESLESLLYRHKDIGRVFTFDPKRTQRIVDKKIVVCDVQMSTLVLNGREVRVCADDTTEYSYDRKATNTIVYLDFHPFELLSRQFSILETAYRYSLIVGGLYGVSMVNCIGSHVPPEHLMGRAKVVVGHETSQFFKDAALTGIPTVNVCEDNLVKCIKEASPGGKPQTYRSLLASEEFWNNY